MRDFLPAELTRRRYVEGVIRQVYESFGFVPVETPAIENLSTLLGKYGEEGDQLLFRILHRRDKLARALQHTPVEERDLAEMGLRYDLTVPLARLIANTKDLPRFFKRYQIQLVWRADRPGRGRFREFQQCDVDITGTSSLIAEAEVCAAVAKVLTELGFKDFFIHLNHRQLLRCLISAAGLRPDQEETALVAVDKMDKIGEEGVLKELSSREIAPESASRLLELLRRPADLDEDGELARLESQLAGIESASAHISQLRELLAISAHSPAGGHLRIDATLARGLGYYTGPIFEIRSSALSGSLGGGGRYDNLIGMFRGQTIPAVGFSIGFERLVLVMEEKGLFGNLAAGPDVMLCRFDDVPPADALKSANELRASGVKVEVYPETPKLGKQLAYAEISGARIAAILGASEIQSGSITLKNLATGEQLTMPVGEASTKIRAWLQRGV